jgi:hypothetical protein
VCSIVCCIVYFDKRKFDDYYEGRQHWQIHLQATLLLMESLPATVSLIDKAGYKGDGFTWTILRQPIHYNDTGLQLCSVSLAQP